MTDAGNGVVSRDEDDLSLVLSTTSHRDGVSDVPYSSRPGKDDEAVDSVASPSRQPLDGDDSALGVGPIDDDLDTRRRQN